MPFCPKENHMFLGRTSKGLFPPLVAQSEEYRHYAITNPKWQRTELMMMMVMVNNLFR